MSSSPAPSDRDAHVAAQRRDPALGANLTRVRATLEAAERQLGYPLAEGFAALNRAERQINKLRRERAEFQRIVRSGEARGVL